MRLTTILLIGTLLIVGTQLAHFKKKAVSELSYGIANIEYDELTSDSLNLNIDFVINNNVDTHLWADSGYFTLFYNDKSVADAEFNQPVTIPPLESVTIPITVSILYKDLGISVAQDFQTDGLAASIRLEGHVTVEGYEFDVNTKLA